jgi:transposase IS66 family protein
MRQHHALARRLLEREDDYLRYTSDGRVPFDNNAAEREIRMSKLRIKISGCMRSMAGAQNFCAIRSYLATAVKHGIGMPGALTRGTSGAAWVPGLPDGRASVRGSTACGEPAGPMNPRSPGMSYKCPRKHQSRGSHPADDHTPREFQR